MSPSRERVVVTSVTESLAERVIEKVVEPFEQPVPQPLVETIHKVNRVTQFTGAQGPAGNPGNTLTMVASEPIPAFSVVRGLSNGRAAIAHSTSADEGYEVIGVATSSAMSGEVVQVVQFGDMILETPVEVGEVFLGVSGELTSNPNTGIVQVSVGYAYTPNRLAVRFGAPILTA